MVGPPLLLILFFTPIPYCKCRWVRDCNPLDGLCSLTSIVSFTEVKLLSKHTWFLFCILLLSVDTLTHVCHMAVPLHTTFPSKGVQDVCMHFKTLRECCCLAWCDCSLSSKCIVAYWSRLPLLAPHQVTSCQQPLTPEESWVSSAVPDRLRSMCKAFMYACVAVHFVSLM